MIAIGVYVYMRPKNVYILITGLLFFISSSVISYPSFAQNDQGALLLYTILHDNCEGSNCSEETLHLLNVRTGEEQMISIGDPFREKYDAGWSPDGRYIWTVTEVGETQWRLHLVDAANGTERIISDELPVDSCLPSSLDWSPDGQYLLFYTGERNDAQFHLFNMTDDSVYSDASLEPVIYIDPVWSPDSQYVVINTTEQDRLIDVSDGTVKFSFEGADYETSFSPDSRYLLYKDESSDDDGLRLYDTVSGDLGRFPGWAKRHSWSSNSRYLVLMRYDDEPGEVYSIYDAQTTVFTVINIGEPIRVGPWINNDTALFLYGNQDGLHYRSVLRYKIDSGNLETLFETTGWIGLAMQHDQWTVIFYSPSFKNEAIEPTTRLYITDGETVIDEEVIVDFYNPFTNAAAVTWSPDGQWMTIAARDGIHRFNADTGILDKVPVEARYIDSPFWSSDSEYLAFETFDPDALGIWNTTKDEIDIMPRSIATIIGWQYGEAHNSLLYCGPG